MLHVFREALKPVPKTAALTTITITKLRSKSYPRVEVSSKHPKDPALTKDKGNKDKK